MPSVSSRQQRFFGAELGREEKGEETETGMDEKELRKFARKPVHRSGKKGGRHMRRHHRSSRR